MTDTIVLEANHKAFNIVVSRDGECYLCVIYKPNHEVLCKFLGDSSLFAITRAHEIIDNLPASVIMDGMEVTKERNLQIGDIVTARLPRKRTSTIGIIHSIRGKKYEVYPIVLTKKRFYEKLPTPSTYQLENLTLFPNRAEWVRIKQDLERENDAEVLQNWLENYDK